MSVRENAGRGNSYWGLVQQNGPWKETAQDRRNKSSPYGVGTGTPRQGRGGTVHEGHGSFDSLTIPGCVSGRKPPPKPSVYAQRSVVYKPLVFDGPRGIAGRIGAKLKHMKGLGDRGHNGHDQGVQTSGNFSGVGVPARQNLSEISQQEAIRQKSETRLAELQQRNKLEDVNPLVQHANDVFGSGGSIRQTGTFGSAAGMTPHPGTEVVPGESVGSVLRKATGEAGKFAGIVGPIPVLGDIARAGAAGLGTAAGAVSAAEALGEGNIAGAIGHGEDAYREAIRLQNITGQVTANWNRNSGAFNTADIVHGESVTFLPIKTGISGGTQTGGGSKNMGTDPHNAVQLTETVGTQYQGGNSALEIAQFEEIQRLIGDMENNRAVSNGRLVDVMNVLGLDSAAVFEALQRGEEDHVIDLIVEARDNLRVPMRLPPLDVTDLVNNQRRQGGLGYYKGGEIFIPPREGLVEQMRHQKRPAEEQLVGSSGLKQPLSGPDRPAVRRRIQYRSNGRIGTATPVNKIEARGGGLKGRGVQQAARAKKAPEGSLRNLAYKALPRRRGGRDEFNGPYPE